MAHEHGTNIPADTFYTEGQKIVAREQAESQANRVVQEANLTEEEGDYTGQDKIELLEGKLLREKLREALEEYLQYENNGMIE